MNSKSNQILVGVIFLLLGVIALIMNYIKLDYGALTLIFSGLAFLLLYYTKKKSWSLVVGSYLFYFGAVRIMGHLGFQNAMPTAVAVMFFLVPGVIFLVLFYHKNKRGLIFPSSLLFWMGIYILLLSISLFWRLRFSLFFVCLGFSFMMMYVFGREFVKKGTLYFGVIMIGVGAFIAVGFSLSTLALLNIPFMISAGIMVIGVGIILKAILKK